MRLAISHTLLLMIVVLICCADSCESNEDAVENAHRELQAEIDSIESQLTSESLTEASRAAYEARAIEKLKDFTGYLSVLADKSATADFRETAFSLLHSLAQDDQLTLVFPVDTTGRFTHITLGILPNTISAMPFEAVRMDIDSISVARPLHRSDSLDYEGTLHYRVTWHVYHARGTVTLDYGAEQRDFHVTKTTKVIGSDTTSAWQLLLGSLAEGD